MNGVARHLNSQPEVQPWSLRCTTTDESSPRSHTDSDSQQQRQSRRREKNRRKTECASSSDESTGSSVAGGHSNLFRTKRTLAHASDRKLTNTTYLRRMHMSKEDAMELFPRVHETIEHVFEKERVSLGSMKIATNVVIQDDKGRRWPIVLECLRTAGQRHVRINKGWAALCSANSLSVGKCVRFERWVEVSRAGKEDIVTVKKL